MNNREHKAGEPMIYSSEANSYPYDADVQQHRRGAPFLAALPSLWLGATICLALLEGKVLTGLPDETLSIVSDISLVIFLAAGLVVAGYAARNEHPLWTASWYGYTLLALAAVPGRIIVLQNQENYIYQLGFLFLAALAVLVGYFLRFRRQPEHALLMVLVFLLLGPLFFLDVIPYYVEVLFVLSLALLAAIIAALMVILRSWALGAALTLGASILAGFAVLLINAGMAQSPDEYSGSLLLSAGMFLSGSLLSLAMIYGPWLFWSAAAFVRRKLV